MHARKDIGKGTATVSSISLETLSEDGHSSSRHGTVANSSPDLPLLQAPGQPAEAYPSGYSLKSSSSERATRKGCGWRMPTGWRLGTTIAAATTLAVLMGNASLLAVFRAQVQREGHTGYIAPVKSGDCVSIKRLGILIHLAINIVSTLLLGASNYCMQTISSPTRSDVDKAHAGRDHLSIGVPSVRNLSHIQKSRVFFWLCLGLTSVPLHLVYNSIFFVSTVNNLYPVYIVDEAFTTGAPWHLGIDRWDKVPFDAFPNRTELDSPNKIQDMLMHTSIFQRLSGDECIEAYAKTVVEDRGTVVVVVEEPKNCSAFEAIWDFDARCDNMTVYSRHRYNTKFMASQGYWVNNWYNWICSQEAQYEKEPPNLCSNGGYRKQLSPNEWEIDTARVRYCLSEKIEPKCQLQVALGLMAVVVAFNAVKFIVIATMAASSLINHEPLVTIGDAAASFLQRPEPTTTGMCLLSASEIVAAHDAGAVSAKEYKPQRLRLAAAVGWGFWAAATGMTIVALGAIFGLFGYAVSMLTLFHDKGDAASIWSLGVGLLTPYTLANNWAIPTEGDLAVICTVLVTNVPQLLLSILYLVLNGLVTAMAAAAEWANYGYGLHRPLRVSFPSGGQRATFFLQMPYRYSVPMLALSALLHWLISQSFFIAQIHEMPLWELSQEEKADPSATAKASTTTTGAYSPMAILLTGIVVLVIYTIALGISRRRLAEGMPLAGSRSTAISAACHPLDGFSVYEPVKWGVVVPADEAPDGIGHCSFSNYHVECVEPGRLYA